MASVSKKTVDVFGVVSFVPVSAADLDDKFLHKTKAVFNPEFGQYDYVDDEPINLDEMVQTYKDDCGLELFKRMKARGEDVSIFADDGMHSADIYDIKTELVDSRNQIAAQQDAINKISQALGVDITGDMNLNEVVQKALEAKSATTNQEAQPNE